MIIVFLYHFLGVGGSCNMYVSLCLNVTYHPGIGRMNPAHQVLPDLQRAPSSHFLHYSSLRLFNLWIFTKAKPFIIVLLSFLLKWRRVPDSSTGNFKLFKENHISLIPWRRVVTGLTLMETSSHFVVCQRILKSGEVQILVFFVDCRAPPKEPLVNLAPFPS